MIPSASIRPHARRAGLTIQTVADEVLVFDSARDEAHVLNRPAAFVWQHADGTRTAQDIADEMTRTFGTSADAQVVWYALEQLGKKHLLLEEARPPSSAPHLTRRQFLQRATAGAVLLAVVTSVVAPTPAHAQSGCVGTGGACTDTADCCSGGVIPSNCCDVPGGRICLVGVCPV